MLGIGQGSPGKENEQETWTDAETGAGAGTRLEHGPHGPEVRGRPGTCGAAGDSAGAAQQSEATILPQGARGFALGAFD